MAKREWKRGVDPNAARIGAAMNDGVCHRLAASGEIFLSAAFRSEGKEFKAAKQVQDLLHWGIR